MLNTNSTFSTLVAVAVWEHDRIKLTEENERLKKKLELLEKHHELEMAHKKQSLESEIFSLKTQLDSCKSHNHRLKKMCESARQSEKPYHSAVSHTRRDRPPNHLNMNLYVANGGDSSNSGGGVGNKCAVCQEFVSEGRNIYNFFFSDNCSVGNFIHEPAQVKTATTIFHMINFSDFSYITNNFYCLFGTLTYGTYVVSTPYSCMIGFLSQSEIRDKYRRDVQELIMYNSRPVRKQRKTFEIQRLGLVNENDAVNKCYTPNIYTRQTITSMIKAISSTYYVNVK